MTIKVTISNDEPGHGTIEAEGRYRSSGIEPGPVAFVYTVAPGGALTTHLHSGLDITLRERRDAPALPRAAAYDDGA